MTTQVPSDDSTSLLPKKLMRSRPLFDPRDRPPGDGSFLREAESGHSVEKSSDVRGRGRRGIDYAVPSARPVHRSPQASDFQIQISMWLWFTVLFANFAEAMAEARGKAQADALRKT
jgi:K+-transporting ATPase ATPase B chain